MKFKKAPLAVISFFAGLSMAQSAPCNAQPNNGWTDSVSVNGKCYCASNFDHGIGNVKPAGFNGLTVRQICNRLGPAPAGNRIPYNDIQCGNGPANTAADEQPNCCPGRVDQGRSGCQTKGPRWDRNAIFGNNGGGGGGGNTNGLPPNNTIVSLKSSNNKFVASENGARAMNANRNAVGSWERFTMVRLNNGKYALRGNNGKYVRLAGGSTLLCDSNGSGNGAAQFTLSNQGGNKVALKASNGKWVSSEFGNRSMTANRNNVGAWERFTWERR